MVTSSDALKKVQGAAVSLTKKKLTAAATEVSGNVTNRLKQKLSDKLSSTSKSASAATTALTGLGGVDALTSGLTGKMGALADLGGLKTGASKAISFATDSLSKAANANTADLFRSKMEGMMGNNVAAMLQGEAQINAKLAPSLVTTGPNDKLLTVDAYDYNPKAIFTSFAGKVSDQATGIFDALGGKGAIAKTVAGVLKKGVSGNLSLDTGALKDRLIQVAGGKTGIINKLSTSFKQGIGEATGIPAGLLNKANVVIDGVARAVATDDIRSASTLFDLVGSVVNDNSLVEFLDMGAKASMLSSIYREAINLGVPEAIDIVVRKANTNDPSALYALGATIDTAVINGNIPTVKLMIDKLGAPAVLAKFPESIRQILASYQFDKDPSEANLTLMYNELMAVLNALDPNWGKFQRNGVWVTDFTVYTNISGHAKQLLSRDTDRVIGMSLASYYPVTSCAGKAREFYPSAVFDLT